MTDTPKNADETTTATTDKDGMVHPDGMNPHIVPEKTDEEKTAEEA